MNEGDVYGEYGVVFGPHGAGLGDESSNAWQFSEVFPIQTGEFSLTISEGLACGTQYDYKVYLGTEGPRLYAGNTETFTTSSCAQEDTETIPPTLSAPTTSTSYPLTTPLTISFTLPESLLHNSLLLTFRPTTGQPIVIHLRDANAEQVNTFTLPLNGTISNTDEVTATSAERIPSGSYTISLSYQDAAGNPAASAQVTNVTIRSAISSGGGRGSSRPVAPVVPIPSVPTPGVPSSPTSSTSPSSFQFTQRLERGSKGTEVTMLQTFLTKLGFNPGPIDGSFGTKTDTAVKKWQETHITEILTPLKRTTGTGIFAKLSRNVANGIIKAGTVTLP
jgi:hypothetical protein